MKVFRKKELCQCCGIRERTMICLVDDEKMQFCDECKAFLVDFLDNYASTKWIEVFRDEVKVKGEKKQ